jgi:hypothetical protein
MPRPGRVLLFAGEAWLGTGFSPPAKDPITMAKITLGKPPKTYAPVTVKFKLPSGEDGVIECVFRYRTRKQFGEFLAATFGATDAGGPSATLADIMAASVDRNGAYLADVLDSWNLEDKLTPQAAAQLADELPAAAVVSFPAGPR